MVCVSKWYHQRSANLRWVRSVQPVPCAARLALLKGPLFPDIMLGTCSISKTKKVSVVMPEILVFWLYT